MPFRAVIWEGIPVAHILCAVVGVDRQLVLCTLLPQMHHLAQVALQFLSSTKHSNPVSKNQGISVPAASDSCSHTHMPDKRMAHGRVSGLWWRGCFRLTHSEELSRALSALRAG